ncbi:MAG: hypothetical protein AAFN93_28030 [Bacteroidota bacterium]
MRGLALSSLRTGKKYKLSNFGEVYEFRLQKILNRDYDLKDLHTLEAYLMSDLLRFGKGEDFEILEI